MADFADIFDQEQIKEHMQYALKTGKVSHAYILSGETGSGKKMMAGTYARALQCQNLREVDGCLEACGECPSCIKVASDSHPDIITIARAEDKNGKIKNSIGVDDVRERLRDDVITKPYDGMYKIYLIPEGEKMTEEAQNAILKTLEEPPSYIVIIIMTSNLNALLQTIISRCVVLPTKPVRDETIKKLLMEKFRVVDYKAELCAAFARGNVGKALELSSNERFEKLKNETIDLVSKLQSLELYDIMERVHALLEPTEEEEKNSKKGIDMGQYEDFMDILTFLFRDMLVYKATESDSHLIFTDKVSYISSVTKKCSYEGISRILREMDTARKRVLSNVNMDLVLELMLLAIKENL